MSQSEHYRVNVPWADIGAALDLLGKCAAGSYVALPIGNRVVIDCATRHDAERLCAKFSNARLVEQQRE